MNEKEIVVDHLNVARHICEQALHDWQDKDWVLMKTRYIQMVNDAMKLAQEYISKEGEDGE